MYLNSLLIYTGEVMDPSHATDVNSESTLPIVVEEIKGEENPVMVEEGKQQEFLDSTTSAIIETEEQAPSSTIKIEDEKEKLQLDAETVSEHPPSESSVAQTSVSPIDSQSNTRNNSSELIVSETFVRIISKAVTQRVKIMQVLAVYFDDIIENENTLTKGLTKVRKPSYSSSYCLNYLLFLLVGWFIQCKSWNEN